MPTTTNFGWTTPADTDYVKDGALAIRTLANGIDTSLVDLKGGTTGQILSKNSTPPNCIAQRAATPYRSENASSWSFPKGTSTSTFVLSAPPQWEPKSFVARNSFASRSDVTAMSSNTLVDCSAERMVLSSASSQT